MYRKQSFLGVFKIIILKLLSHLTFNLNVPDGPFMQFVVTTAHFLSVKISVKKKKKKRHRFIEQSFRFCGRRRGWDVSREQHRNMYGI